MTEIAIVDDEKAVLTSLRIGLGRKGYTVRTFPMLSSFLTYIKDNEPDVVLLDLLLPDGHGLEVLKTLGLIPTIIITAHGDIPSAVSAMKLGAYDYISKPFDLDVIEMLIAKACKQRRLVREVAHHRRRSYQQTTLDDVIGESPPMKKLFDKLHRLSQVDATNVLLLGESGTGKDLLAKAIHNLGSRKDKQFIDINCAALPEQLLESELFGHERGAFTDAKAQKIGLAELADGGTLFLDEVGELPFALQAKLLKFLEARTFRRVGGTAEKSVDLFVIASTNRDLEKAVAAKSFRQDLYYRLRVVPITVPPLRQRGEDVDLIVSYYWRQFTRKFNKPMLALGRQVRDALRAYDWPGNVRELKNLLEQLVILSSADVIQYEDLPGSLLARLERLPREKTSMLQLDSTPVHGTANRSLTDAVDALEKEKICQALIQSGGVKSKAAKRLGISRYTLLRKLKRYGHYFQ